MLIFLIQQIHHLVCFCCSFYISRDNYQCAINTNKKKYEKYQYIHFVLKTRLNREKIIRTCDEEKNRKSKKFEKNM